MHTGFSLAYNAGTALGGTAPAITTALITRFKTDGAAAPAHLAPSIWLVALAGPAAAAALWLMRAAPQVRPAFGITS